MSTRGVIICIICGHPATKVETKLDGVCVSYCLAHARPASNTMHEVLREIRRKQAARNILRNKPTRI
jgi:hypothetical protein